MLLPAAPEHRLRAALRVLLSYYVMNGAIAAVGLALVSALVHAGLGAFAAATASVGVIVVIPPDQPAPRRGKFWQLLPAALIGTPLFWAVQVLHERPLQLTVLLVTAAFVAFLIAAWGKRGIPISVSVMFSMIFSMAAPPSEGEATLAMTSLYFALGAFGYIVFATLAWSLLNARLRVQMLADTLLAVAALARTQARQFTPDPVAAAAGASSPLVGLLLRNLAALTDQLQAARDILLEQPQTARRQQLAAMLLQILELRDHLVACELDLDALRGQPEQLLVLQALRSELEALAGQLELLADDLLMGRRPVPFVDDRARPELPPLPDDDSSAPAAPAPDLLARGLVNRMGYIHDEVRRLTALARGDAAPDLALVRASWQMFISPTHWSWQPLAGLWRWDAPPMRHAIRAALAIAAGQIISLALPWGTHDYWILLTITVVLRGSLAQTLERRNIRVAGTLVGCLLVGGLLAVHAPLALLLAIITVGQGMAHAFAVRRYLVTVVAATVMALLQAHLLHNGTSPAFELLERVWDTLIGAGLAWAFSYVLPSWERGQIPALVARTLAAQARHAREALALGQLQAVDNQTELAWRLARREAHDSLSALAQAAQRSLSEPRAVRPPLEPLGRMLAHSYQLLGQLTAVKTMLLLRRGRLKADAIQAPLQLAASAIDAALTARALPTAPLAPAGQAAAGPVLLPDPFTQDLSPWLLRRLNLAGDIALRLRADAQPVLQPEPPR